MTSDNQDHDLDALFSEARRAVDAPMPQDFTARLLADAAMVQRDLHPPQAPRRGWLASCLADIGGWPAVAGLVSATVAGIWIGGVDPALLETVLPTDALGLESYFPTDGLGLELGLEEV